jgi:hypothetical protein
MPLTSQGIYRLLKIASDWRRLAEDDVERQAAQVFEQNIGLIDAEIVARGNSGVHGDRADMVPLGGDDIAGCVAYQRDGRAFRNPSLRVRAADGKARQPCAVLGHFAKRSEAKIWFQTGAFQLFPSDARKVTRNEAQQHATLLQTAQEKAHAGTCFALQVGDTAHVDLLRAQNDAGHGAANGRRRRACFAKHAGEDVRIEHAVYGNVIGAGFETGDAANRIDQRLAMMQTGAAHKGAVDIE